MEGSPRGGGWRGCGEGRQVAGRGGKRERNKNLWTGRDGEGQSTGIYGLCRNPRRATEWGVHPGETCRDPARTGSHLAMLELSLVRVGVRVEGRAPDTPSRPFIPIYPPRPESRPGGRKSHILYPAAQRAAQLRHFAVPRRPRGALVRKATHDKPLRLGAPVAAVMRPGSSRRVERASRGSRRCSAQAPG